MDNILKYWDGSKDEFSNRPADSSLGGFNEIMAGLIGTKKVLDIGCGIGNTVAYLNNNGFDAIGITYQKEEVDYATSIGRTAIIHGDMHKLPFEDSIFDACIMSDSLEHSIAPLAALGEAKRVTKNGGKICLFVPGQVWTECEYHIIVPTRRQMKHLFYLADLELTTLIDYWGDEQAVYIVKVNK